MSQKGHAGFSLQKGLKVMSLLQGFVFIILLGFFSVVAPVTIFVFAKCFTGRGWTFMDYNPDEEPQG
jgi:hypothetical protein